MLSLLNWFLLYVASLELPYRGSNPAFNAIYHCQCSWSHVKSENHHLHAPPCRLCSRISAVHSQQVQSQKPHFLSLYSPSPLCQRYSSVHIFLPSLHSKCTKSSTQHLQTNISIAARQPDLQIPQEQKYCQNSPLRYIDHRWQLSKLAYSSDLPPVDRPTTVPVP